MAAVCNTVLNFTHCHMVADNSSKGNLGVMLLATVLSAYTVATVVIKVFAHIGSVSLCIANLQQSGKRSSTCGMPRAAVR